MNLLRAAVFVFACLLATLGTTGCARSGRPVPPTAPPLGVPASPTTTGAMTPWPTPTPTPIGGGLPGANPAGTSGLSVGFPVYEVPKGYEKTTLSLDFKMERAVEKVCVDVMMDTRRTPLYDVERWAGTAMTWTMERVSDNPRFDTRVKLDFTFPADNYPNMSGVLAKFVVTPGEKLEEIPFSPQRPLEPERATHFDMLVDGALKPSARTGAPKRIRGSLPGLEWLQQ